MTSQGCAGSCFYLLILNSIESQHISYNQSIHPTNIINKLDTSIEVSLLILPLAEEAVKGYAEKYIRVIHVGRAEHTASEITEMRNAVATQMHLMGG